LFEQETKPTPASKTRVSFSPPCVIGLLVLVLSGCSFGPEVNDHDIALESAFGGTPLVTASDASVGVHYDAALFEKEMRLDIREGQDLERYHFIAGPRTVELFERVFAALFRDHRRVAGRPPLNEDTDGLDGVVEVRLAQVSSYAMDYRVTLFELSGREVYEWQARGSIAREVRDVEDAVEGLRTAMRDAAAQFLVAFRDPPQVQWWLMEPGAAFEDAPPPAGPF
jgi:hypothetical protein